MFLVSQKEFRVHRHASLLFMDTRADFQVDALLRRLCARPSAQLADGLAQRQRCERASGLRTPVNNIEYFPPSFEGLVLGCIDADFCK